MNACSSDFPKFATTNIKILFMKSTVIKYGLYGFITAGILFTLGLVFGKNLSYSAQEVIGYASIVICLLFVFFGIKHFRDNVNNGSVSFGKALSIGIMISVLAGLGVALVDAIYTTFINPDFFDQYAQRMEEMGRSDEVIEMGSGLMAAVMFMTVVVIGFIISLISSLILHRK